MKLPAKRQTRVFYQTFLNNCVRNLFALLRFNEGFFAIAIKMRIGSEGLRKHLKKGLKARQEFF